MTIDLSFPIIAAQPILADHGYHLYAALSNALPVLHQHNGIAVHQMRNAAKEELHIAVGPIHPVI